MWIATAALLICLSATVSSAAIAGDKQVCDVAADFALGSEDYPGAIVLYQNLLRSHPENGLAHYYLGFAYGMVGRAPEEIVEYQAAVNLGMDKWDLFLNLGLAYLGQHEFTKATAALETAVLLGPEHPETHFNLAIVYERQNRLHDALREITASRRLAPEDLDAGNTNAIIYAEMGDLACAHDVWTHLVRIAPDYAPARSNLALLSKSIAPTCQFEQHSDRSLFGLK